MSREPRAKLGRRVVLALGPLLILIHLYFLPTGFYTRRIHPVPAQCLSLNAPLEPPPEFTVTRLATGSDRFVQGTRPTLIKDAKILTGARNGTEGVIVAVGYIPEHLRLPQDLQIIDAEGKWISPGLVDAHSHLGVHSAPALAGASDGNSRKAPILPWLRSIDGINTHDDAYKLAIAGGVTTAQILPGSANNIGGQAFLIKLRSTAERSTSSLLLEPPETLFLNNSRPAWRHMKYNPDRLYGQTRMDAAWGFRQAYNEARKIRDAQDAFCAAAHAGTWDGRSAFPESLQWEALVDVLRGRVKLSVHCYEAVDLDALIRLSNEFKFPVASIHHAGETYLVPDLLKRAWQKREAYRGSEFASRILADNGLPVIMKSDHPAQQAHYYSLNTGLAIASVTSTPAKALGVGWRIGTIAEDLVLWDSHPLALGATPIQVFIDGIPQLHNASFSSKPDAFQHVPQTPSFEKEVRDTIAHEGLPPLAGRRATGTIAFVNVRSAWVRRADGIRSLADAGETNLTVIVHGGRIACAGPSAAGACAEFVSASAVETVDLRGGALAPGLTSFGSDLGLSEIMLEPSTNDGPVFDPLTVVVPSILGHTTVRAVDGLQFGGRNTLLLYDIGMRTAAGVTTAVVAPQGNGFLQGLGTAFDVGAPHALAAGAIVQDETSLHIRFTRECAQASARRLRPCADFCSTTTLRGPGRAFARYGQIPLVIHVDSADIMATVLRLKTEYEAKMPYTLWITFTGASEAHLLAAEIGAAHVSVILSPARPYPADWNSRRILPGPPLSTETATTTLLKHGVNVGLGVSADYDARNARFEIAWAALDSNGSIDYSTALALASANIEKALGVKSHTRDADELVVFQSGDMFDFESKVIGIISARKTAVEFSEPYHQSSLGNQ
ncbi:hypothetical protein B0H14DRAFT_2741976 [Mycena olivaceomarginata]|nr:hypothetical protein B0H14DRAFT_2741976 [Mycena olivaceomarginata]